MFHTAIHYMNTSKEFYVETMGFKVIKYYGHGDIHWVSLELAEGRTSIHLATAHEKMKSETMKLPVLIADMQAAYKQLGE